MWIITATIGGYYVLDENNEPSEVPKREVYVVPCRADKFHKLLEAHKGDDQADNVALGLDLIKECVREKDGSVPVIHMPDYQILEPMLHRVNQAPEDAEKN